MQVSISPKGNAPAVGAARAWIRNPVISKETEMTHNIVKRPRNQALALIRARRNADFQRFLRKAMGVSA